VTDPRLVGLPDHRLHWHPDPVSIIRVGGPAYFRYRIPAVSLLLICSDAVRVPAADGANLMSIVSLLPESWFGE